MRRRAFTASQQHAATGTAEVGGAASQKRDVTPVTGVAVSGGKSNVTAGAVGSWPGGQGDAAGVSGGGQPGFHHHVAGHANEACVGGAETEGARRPRS